MNAARLLVLGVALALDASAALAQQDDGQAAQLEALRSAIEEHRDRVTGFEREERGLLETLESMDRAAEALTRDAGLARREARAARAALVEIEGELGRLEERVSKTQSQLARRAVALYKAGDLGPVRALFSAGTLRDALERAGVLQRLVRHDRALLLRADDERQAFEAARTEAAELASERDASVARLRQRAAELERERVARRELLARVRVDRRQERAALNELEAAAQALEETLAHLRSAPAPGAPVASAGAFAALRGSLEPPAEAPIALAFGVVVDEEFRTQTLRKGVEFATRVGDPVYAVADGRVRFAGWFRGYGKIAIVDHGDDYFTVSGHLESLAVALGDTVRVGDRIGSAGETGSLTGPTLYFEIRQGGDALDPGEWLARGGSR